MGIEPKVKRIKEKADAQSLEKPGDYCYKQIAVAGDNPEKLVHFRKAVLINCPFCNRSQYLTPTLIDYKLGWKNKVNKLTDRIFKKKFFQSTNAELTIGAEIVCAFNQSHKYQIIKNQISSTRNKNGSTKLVSASDW